MTAEFGLHLTVHSALAERGYNLNGPPAQS